MWLLRLGCSVPAGPFPACTFATARHRRKKNQKCAGLGLVGALLMLRRRESEKGIFASAIREKRAIAVLLTLCTLIHSLLEIKSFLQPLSLRSLGGLAVVTDTSLRGASFLAHTLRLATSISTLPAGVGPRVLLWSRRRCSKTYSCGRTHDWYFYFRRGVAFQFQTPVPCPIRYRLACLCWHSSTSLEQECLEQ